MAYKPQYGPGSSTIAENRRKQMDPSKKLEKVRDISPGEILIIDFPQVVDCLGNDQARDILRRDLTRTCEYFASQGVECDAEALTGDLWGQYVGSMLREQLADLSMREYERGTEAIEEA